jgi:hypothetical protein
MNLDAGNFSSRRTNGRFTRWVGLLALAGLLTVATLPCGPRQGDDGVEHITADQGVSTWHG